MKVKVDYTFIFEPAETWETKAGFDDWLAKALRDSGLVAERVKTNLQDDRIIEEMLIIHEIPQTPAEEKATMSLKQRKDMFTKKRDETGKFRKTNE